MRNRRILPALAMALALGLAGCGSDDDSDASPEAVPSDDAMTDEESDSMDDDAVDDMDDDKDDDADDESSDDRGDDADDDADDKDTANDKDDKASGPDFTGTTVDGEAFDAATLAGEPVVLWFWAPWCPKCMAQAPAVLDVAAEHKDDVAVVGVAGLADAGDMPEFIENTGTGELTHLSDPDGEIWRKYDVAEQSTFVMLDSAGEEVASGNMSDDELADKVNELDESD